MPRDIRSYFTSTKTQVDAVKSTKPARRRAISSSDEEESNGPKLKSKKKSEKIPKKKDKTHVLSDSDDDTSRNRSKKKSNSPVKKTAKALKPVGIESVFSNTPIKRINATPVPEELQQEEALIHDDDDFEATLDQIDISEIDAMYAEGTKGKSANGKRKKSTSEEDAPSKKLKPDDLKEVNNKDKKLVQKPHRSNEVKSNKLESSNDEKPTHSRGKKLHSNVVVEKNMKEKKSKSKDEDKSDLLEEYVAKKKQHVEKYQAYLHRGGARNPGSKSIPKGAENCLAGLSFVVTGILESLERDETDSLIEKYGGRVVKALSRKTDYLVVGEEAGESKLEKARSLQTKQISEDELLELIRSRPAGKASKILHSRSKKKEPSPQKTVEKTPPKLSLVEQKNAEKTEVQSIQSSGVPGDTAKRRSDTIKSTSDGKQTVTSPKLDPAIKPPTVQDRGNNEPKNEAVRVPYAGQAQALVEKYRPTSFKQIIGQHGDKSTARKFYTWIQNWHKNQNSKMKPTKPSPWAKNDDGSFFKACLFSGPPGVGKTTTVQVVCNELGYDLLEFNASDTRSKRLLKEEISGLLSNTTVKGYFSNNSDTKTSAKHVLLMDEVDGMAGNEDRGGLQELISLIKSTEIPIVCICNDRNNPKMRTLSNYTFDLRFQKPRVEQIRGAMKSLCCKENISIATEDLDRLIQSTNQDIRQVINHLAMLVNTGSKKNIDKTEDNCVNKDLKLGPWDVVRKVFSAEDHKTMSIHDKSDLFFHDYNIAGLFVQENYLAVAPKCPKDELLDRVAATAESLAMGDLVENSIRGNNSWSLLPMQACFSSVIPGTLMAGHMNGQINFPAWLGRNSKRGKFDRLLQEITVHTRLVTGASKEAINLDYLKPLRDAIMRPLVTDGSEGVEAALSTMNHYHLLRDDLDALVEVSLWPGQRDPMQSVESKVKAAFTRTYNKSAAPTPFSVGLATNKKGGLQTQDSGFLDGIEDNETESDDENDDTLDRDRMVKAKKPTASKTTTATSKDKASTSRGGGEKTTARRGRGRGRGK